MAPNVKFPRDIRQGNMGKDVIAHKRAISRARPDFYPWHEFTNYAGGPFIDAVIRWKKSRRMNSIPKLGRTAHEVLERTPAQGKPDEWAFDAKAIELAQEYYDAVQAETREQRIRNQIVSAGFYWYSHRMAINYSNARPFQLGKPPWIPSRWDCSAFFTACHYAGGGRDPNGRGYDHLGYTGTLCDYGNRVSTVDLLEPGDAIMYGHTKVPKPGFPFNSPTHVAMYAGKIEGMHMVLSLGHYPMGFYEYRYRNDINHYRHYRII